MSKNSVLRRIFGHSRKRETGDCIMRSCKVAAPNHIFSEDKIKKDEPDRTWDT